MKLTATMAGMFLCAFVFVAQTKPAHAEVSKPLSAIDAVSISDDAFVKIMELPVEKPVDPAPAPEPPKPVEHIVAPGESLTAIAAANATTWQRLYAKNESIQDPDTVTVGAKIVIPAPEEQLPERVAPVDVVPEAPAPVVRSQPASTPSTTVSRGSTGGNSYIRGYCTWYAKTRRPDMPNNLGNADTWVSRAAAQGLPTGSVPRAGAIGQQGMHVVYIEQVNSDGTVLISEMNYNGYNVISSRTVAASNFRYIY